MQNQTQQAPAPAAAPEAPAGQATAGPAGTEAVAPAAGVLAPMTSRDLAALRTRRSELSDQLNSAVGRRNRLVEQLREADPAARPGLEQRLQVLDSRIVQLELDIASTGRLVTEAPSELLTSSSAANEMFGGLPPGGVVGISIVFTIFVLAPIALSAARLLWKRGSRRPAQLAAPKDVSDRLERIEQSVEAIAIEVERVSEGQRFVTRLLSDGEQRAGIGRGERAALPGA